jgi:hypothetical protein
MLDEAVPVTASTAVFEQLTACGGSATLTVYSDLDHVTIMPQVLDNLALYQWLFSHYLSR